VGGKVQEQNDPTVNLPSSIHLFEPCYSNVNPSRPTDTVNLNLPPPPPFLVPFILRWAEGGEVQMLTSLGV